MQKCANFRTLVAFACLTFFLSGCSKNSGNKVATESASGNQQGVVVNDSSKQLKVAPTEPKPISYEKGAAIKGKFKDAEMVMVMASGGAVDLMNVENSPMFYSGHITVILPDGRSVDVACPLKILRKLHGYENIKPKGDKEGLVTSYKAKAQESDPQELILIYEGYEKWKVQDIVK